MCRAVLDEDCQLARLQTVVCSRHVLLFEVIRLSRDSLRHRGKTGHES